MKKRTILLGTAATTLVLGMVPAFANNNIYVTVFGGVNTANDVDGLAGGGGNIDRSFDSAVTHTGGGSHTHPLHFDLNMVTTFFNSGASADTGFIVGVAVGRDMDDWLPGLRTEVEFSYRHNALKDATASGFASANDTASDNYSPGGLIYHNPRITPVPPLASGGSSTATLPGSGTYAFAAHTETGFNNSNPGTVRTFAIMANVFYDIELGSPIVPYVGGGVGYARTEVKASHVFSGDDKNFAWQLGAGFNYTIDEHMSLGVGYRYFNGGDIDVEIPTLTDPALVNYEVEDHAGIISLTWRQ